MKISVFGLGYVGCVTAACFAEVGHIVLGVDVNRDKIDSINKGNSPIIEPGIADLVRAVVARGNMRATINTEEAVAATEVSFICVGTPSLTNGDVDLSTVKTVCQELGNSLRWKPLGHVVVLRSTLLPGSTEGEVIPILEESSGLTAGKEFHVVYNPEFLREGTAIADFKAPSRTIIGESCCNAGERVVALYSSLNAPIVRTTIRVAEMVKYIDNAFHALKVAFTNEVAFLCRVHAIDSREVMNIFRMDKKLNLSEAYLEPGYAFGGSCLPKDLRALVRFSRQSDGEFPLLEAILRSNELHKRRGVELIHAVNGRSVAVMGLSFKPKTDDLRESPAVELIEGLIGKGYEVRVYDPYVSLGNLVGSNKAYIESVIPHVARLLCRTAEQAVTGAQIIVFTSPDESYTEVLDLLDPHQIVIDLVGVVSNPNDLNCQYLGIGW